MRVRIWKNIKMISTYVAGMSLGSGGFSDVNVMSSATKHIVRKKVASHKTTRNTEQEVVAVRHVAGRWRVDEVLAGFDFRRWRSRRLRTRRVASNAMVKTNAAGETKIDDHPNMTIDMEMITIHNATESHSTLCKRSGRAGSDSKVIAGP